MEKKVTDRCARSSHRRPRRPKCAPVHARGSYKSADIYLLGVPAPHSLLSLHFILRLVVHPTVEVVRLPTRKALQLVS